MSEPSGGDRILGIVGGTGPESTVDYYRSLIATWRRRRTDGSYPRVIINSVEAGRVFDRLAARDFEAVGQVLGPDVAALAAAGCQRALLASNASHLAFERIDPPPAIPLIHIVETTRDAATQAGFRRLGLIGTSFVMESDLYATRLAPAGIEVVIPIAEERGRIHEIYFGELVAGIIRDESRATLAAVVATMRDRDGIDAIVLGGTELALILTEPTCADLPVLNTAQIQVDAAVDWLLGGA
jgi:aspartate racemase